MVWYPRHKPKLKGNFTGVVYTYIQSAISVFILKGLYLNDLGDIGQQCLDTFIFAVIETYLTAVYLM